MSGPGSRRKFDPVRGSRPSLQFLQPEQLEIDPDYQRGMDDKRSAELVSRIARQWNWDLCQPLAVARRPSGALFVIDGQHRLAAARMRGDIDDLPCVVTPFSSPAAEAESFVKLNQSRKPLTRLDLFRAAVAGGEARAGAIAAALKEAGLKLAPHMNAAVWKPGMVSNIGGIERAWNRDGAAVAQRGLVALAQAFAGQVLAYGGTLYRPIVRVCRDEAGRAGDFRGERFELFVAMLQRRTQQQWSDAFGRHFAENSDLFRGESADVCMLQEWRLTQGGSTSETGTAVVPARRVSGEPSPELELKRPPGTFGLGANNWKGDEEWAWCAQCDCRRTKDQVLNCASPFCKIKAARHG